MYLISNFHRKPRRNLNFCKSTFEIDTSLVPESIDRGIIKVVTFGGL